jgi:hypothetical protein
MTRHSPPRRLRRERRWLRQLLLLTLLLSIAFGAIGQRGFSRTRVLSYRDSSKPVSVRVADLLGRMTLAEKVGQLAQVTVTKLATEADYDEVFATEKVGSILSGGGELPGTENTPLAGARGGDLPTSDRDGGDTQSGARSSGGGGNVARS